MATPRRPGSTSVMSAPPMRKVPSVMVSRPAMDLSRVVLPHPEGPSRAKNSPSAMDRSTPSTPRTPLGYCFTRPSMTIVAVMT